MSSTLTSQSYDEIANDIEEVARWLMSHGLTIEPTRISKYKADVRALESAYQNGKTNAFVKEISFPRLASSLYEAAELINIWKGLRDIRDPDLAKRLALLVKGPARSVWEQIGISSKPRDIGFELFIGASFGRAGFRPSFDPAGDVTIHQSDRDIFVECKRPKSKRKIERSVKKAFSQLQKRYRGQRNSYGIIALSITKLLNPDAMLLVVDTPEQLHQKVAGIVENFIRSNEPLWQTRKDGKTLGVLVSFQTYAVVRGLKHFFTTAHFMGANNLTYPGTDDHNYFMGVASKLNPA